MLFFMINKYKNRQLYCLHLLKKLDRKKRLLLKTEIIIMPTLKKSLTRQFTFTTITIFMFIQNYSASSEVSHTRQPVHEARSKHCQYLLFSTYVRQKRLNFILFKYSSIMSIKCCKFIDKLTNMHKSEAQLNISACSTSQTNKVHKM